MTENKERENKALRIFYTAPGTREGLFEILERTRLGEVIPDFPRKELPLEQWLSKVLEKEEFRRAALDFLLTETARSEKILAEYWALPSDLSESERQALSQKDWFDYAAAVFSWKDKIFIFDSPQFSTIFVSDIRETEWEDGTLEARESLTLIPKEEIG